MKKYQSSSGKLVSWLYESRENWKKRAKLKQQKLRAAAVKIRDLENSREFWKKRADMAEKELLQVRTAQSSKQGQKKGSH